MDKATIVDEVNEITDGQGVTSLIEATGLPQTVPQVLPLVGRFGEVILLGTPRGRYETDLTEVLSYIHIDPMGNVTFKGALSGAIQWLEIRLSSIRWNATPRSPWI